MKKNLIFLAISTYIPSIMMSGCPTPQGVPPAPVQSSSAAPSKVGSNDTSTTPSGSTFSPEVKAEFEKMVGVKNKVMVQAVKTERGDALLVVLSNFTSDKRVDVSVILPTRLLPDRITFLAKDGTVLGKTSSFKALAVISDFTNIDLLSFNSLNIQNDNNLQSILLNMQILGLLNPPNPPDFNAWFTISGDFDSCLLGSQLKIGPYGSFSDNLTAGCG